MKMQHKALQYLLIEKKWICATFLIDLCTKIKYNEADAPPFYNALINSFINSDEHISRLVETLG